MHVHLKECDKWISTTWSSWMKYGNFWMPTQDKGEQVEAYQTRLKERRSLFDEALNMFQYANRYNLKDTLNVVGDGMALLMKDRPLDTRDLFDPQAVKLLLDAIGPLSYTNEDGLKFINAEGCVCKALLVIFKNIIRPHTACLSQELVDHQEAFPALVWSFKQNNNTEKRAKVKNKKDMKAASRIIKKILEKGPDRISRELPKGRNMGNEGHEKKEKIDECGKRKLKEVLKKIYTEINSEDFARLKIALPQGYYES